MNQSNPNMRKVVTVETREFNSMYVEGLVLECGHWQKMPSGLVCSLNNANYMAFVTGNRCVSCRHCAQIRRESMRVPNVN